MPEANSALFTSNPPIRDPRIAPAPARKPRFLCYSGVKTKMIYTHVSLAVTRPGFAARSTDLEKKQDDFMPIRIRRHDKKQQGTHVV